jgi:cyanate permease
MQAPSVDSTILLPRVVISPGRHSHRREFVLRLIVYYVVFMIAGDLAAYVIGLITEEAFGGQVSLIVFLTLYFLFLWVSWVLAVWMTEPKHAEPERSETA